MPTVQPDEEEKQWVDDVKRAKDKQRAAHAKTPPTEAEWDAQVKAAADKQAAAARAMAVTPGSLVVGGTKDPWDIDMTASAPRPSDLVVPTPPGAQAPAIKPGSTPTDQPAQALTIWMCNLDGQILYSPSWDHLKGLVKNHNGTHQVNAYTFLPTVQNVIGFFTKDQSPVPTYSAEKHFDIIVAGGKVFRDEG